ncbi:predicted protein [Arabidopsis lyrata subsp. lyrata]|uniref:Predicted protein n=1 Tax=Arabidopsis lyrata subsp. lyrata TaxID=81972 RepID=D7KF90_ARALL|nr:predicted protein [Arabidopsis lyrata subsp. lyrata]
MNRFCVNADEAFKYASEREEKQEERNKRLLKRGNSQQNHENLYGAPASSALRTPQNPPCSEPMVSITFALLSLTAESQKTTTKSPLNPYHRIETGLTASDVHQIQSRLLIPFNKLLRNDFLTTAEAQTISRAAVRKEDEEYIGV